MASVTWGNVEWGTEPFATNTQRLDVEATFSTSSSLVISQSEVIHFKDMNIDMATTANMKAFVLSGLLEIQIAIYLDNQAIVSFEEFNENGNCFINILPSEPDKAVGIYSQGGPQPSPKFVEQDSDIQFLVRGTRDPRVAQNLAESIFNELQGLDHVTLSDGTELISIKAIQPKPIHIGRDDNGRHKFSLNYRVRHEAETKHRTKNY